MKWDTINVAHLIRLVVMQVSHIRVCNKDHVEWSMETDARISLSPEDARLYEQCGSPARHCKHAVADQTRVYERYCRKSV